MLQVDPRPELKDEFPKGVWNWLSCDEQRTPTPVSLYQPSLQATRSSGPFGSRLPGACPNARRSPLTTIDNFEENVVNVPYIHPFRRLFHQALLGVGS